ncbi:MAG TPA: lipopolysaccharide heptosyltransferase II, partial [Bryobacteraceae bacterium]|nr:lipopolysaccharide heptosyltransferase II [Bryobacteraceae bacterium]
MPFDKILVRATNWVGDAVMSLPALRALRDRFPRSEISILAKPWVADLYRREPVCDRLIPYTATTLASKYRAASELRAHRFDTAILLQNAFEAAAIAFAARIPNRIGYARDARSPLLTQAIPVPRPNDIPRHQRFYYLELLRRAAILEKMPANDFIRLESATQARTAGAEKFRSLGLGDVVIGISPGAAYGNAKRWLPDRFAEAANRIATQIHASVAVFGSPSERDLCASVAAAIAAPARNFAGETSLAE